MSMPKVAHNHDYADFMGGTPDYTDDIVATNHDYVDVMSGTPKDGNPILSSYSVS